MEGTSKSNKRNSIATRIRDRKRRN